MKWIPSSLILILLFSLCSCLDEIGLPESAATPDAVAITGFLKKGNPNVIKVHVEVLINYLESETPKTIDDAFVQLSDGVQFMDIPFSKSGDYLLEFATDDPGFSVDFGKSYFVQVNIPGRGVYQSQPDQLHQVPKPDSITTQLGRQEILNDANNVVEQNILTYSITTPLTAPLENDKALLKWELEGVYRIIESVPPIVAIPNPRTCYVSDQIGLGKVFLFNGNNTFQDKIQKFELMDVLVDFRYSRGYYFSLYQQSLSQEAYQYWENVKAIIERNGSFFEAPPGKITGNIIKPDNPKEEVFGFFYATKEDTIRLYVNQDRAGLPRPECPPISEETKCLNCILRLNSSLEKPSYWIE